jgi:hypothetical protein
MGVEEWLGGDPTHVRNVADPSRTKRASGDSGSGFDAATTKALGENIAVNGLLYYWMPPTVDRADQSHLNNDRVTSLSAAKGVERRSERINELAFGLDSGKFQSSRANSLGDMMCELMLLMIQSTSERRQTEREMGVVMAAAQVVQSEKIAKEILGKAKVEVDQIKKSAWIQLGISIGVAAVTVGGMVAQGVQRSGGATTDSMKTTFAKEKQWGGYVQLAGGIAAAFANISDVKEIAQYEESIQRKQTALALTKSVAKSVQSSLKDIDSTREYFMNLMGEISQAIHDNKMQIIRNSRV